MPYKDPTKYKEYQKDYQLYYRNNLNFEGNIPYAPAFGFNPELFVYQCGKCHKVKEFSEFQKSTRFSDGIRKWCKDCEHGYYEYNPDIRWKNRLKTYGLTVEEYNIILQNQNGGCAICGAKIGNGSKRLGVDHNHITGKVRGILCNACNTGIGLLNNIELLNKAIEYIKRNTI